MTAVVGGTGVKVVGDPAAIAGRMPEFKGRHLWVFVGMWQVANPAASAQDFDMENLLSIDGPGCFWCEQVWRPTIGAKCPGDPA